MDKKDFDFKLPENESLKIGGYEITIKPYLSLADQLHLINEYVSTYFHSANNSVPESEWDVFNAENALTLAVIDICTDINIEKNLEFILSSSDFCTDIFNSIENYWEFYNLLTKIVDKIEQQISYKKSVGGVIESLYVQVDGLIKRISEIAKDITPETLDKLKEVGLELTEKINASPVATILEDKERGK